MAVEKAANPALPNSAAFPPAVKEIQCMSHKEISTQG